MESSSVRNRPGHYLLWGGGVLVAILPYIAFFIQPEWRASWILEPGRFADNLVVAMRHILIGATLGGWIWFLLNRVNPVDIFRSWWREPVPFNWIWFFLSLAIYSTHNILVLMNLPLTTGEFISAAAGRVLTALIILSFFWMGARIASMAAPYKLRYLPWAIPAVIPGILGADALAIIFWKNSLRFVMNKIDEDGPLNVARQLSAAGFEKPPSVFLFGILIAILVLCGLCYLSFCLSRKASPRVGFRPAFVLLALGLTWGGIAAEKASGFAWKSRKALRMEHNSYEIHLTPIKPEPGLVSYQAAWHPFKEPDLTGHATIQPDIYIFMLESVRSDAISPEHAPFLTQFRDEECQQLGQTWAASNATHLSWYSFFNGQIPPYWGDAVDVIQNQGSLPPSPLIRALQNSNYKIQGRTVCDVSYQSMGATNFGEPHGLEIFKSAPAGSEFSKSSIAERELKNLEDAMEVLGSSPSGGNFQFLAYDSPHFDYEWHPSFTPPYTDYEPSGGFHAYPKPEDIERVRRRYLNSIAWTDHEIARFVNFLKEEHRYDDALIIITGDHGEEFQENGSWFHCSSLEEEQTAVPLMIKWPAGTEAPDQVSASHLDVLPSVLDFLGYPESTFSHLPGRSLLKKHDEEGTQVTITSYCGITGIAMAWQRGDYKATFRWKNPWSTQLPDTISLDDLTDANGSLDLATPEEWDTALRKHFPNVFDRYFSRFEKK
ncbi:MAG: sulfatase-like hydrolase/transferase [Akkermansiaceae bacterium]